MHRALVLFAAALSLGAQDLLPPEVLMLSRIRARVREAVERLPDCTCVETVVRYQKTPGKDKDLRFMDNIVFQVLFSGNKELFAEPGGTHWENSPFPFISGGMLGNGLFVLHLRSVFLDNQSLIRYHGMEDAAGRREARYDFSISRMLSGYTIHRGNMSAVAAVRGSFWADPESYDLRRLEFHAEELAPELLYSGVFTSISYERVRVGETELLLPQSADLRTVSFDGGESRDRIEFTHCQGFHTESTLTFDEPAAGAAPAPAPTSKALVQGMLPPGLRVTIALSAALDNHSPTGSVVEGKIVDNVVEKGKLLVPAGAAVKGRVRRLEFYDEDGGYYVIALEFTTIETPGREMRYYANMQDLERRAGAAMTLTRSDTTPRGRILTQTSTPSLPGVGTFFVRGSRFQLPSGFRTVWRTQIYPADRSR
jgi:hypothetical protein